MINEVYELNHMALIAYICNSKLTRQRALEITGIKEKQEVSIDSNTRNTKLANENVAEIRYLYDEKGYTTQQLGTKFDLSQAAMVNYMERNGIKRRKKGIIPKKLGVLI